MTHAQLQLLCTSQYRCAMSTPSLVRQNAICVETPKLFKVQLIQHCHQPEHGLICLGPMIDQWYDKMDKAFEGYVKWYREYGHLQVKADLPDCCGYCIKLLEKY